MIFSSEEQICSCIFLLRMTRGQWIYQEAPLNCCANIEFSESTVHCLFSILY